MVDYFTYYNERVRKQVLNLPAGILADDVRLTDAMTIHGADLRMPHSKAMGSGLFELRPKGPDGIGRVFYCTQVGNVIVVLHSFVKKSQETPDAELRLAAEGHSIGNYKSLLQQLVQGSCKGSPVYRLVGESGPDHSKYFEVAAEITGKRYASAWGRSKKDAEQRAAANALAELRGEEPPFPNSYIQNLMNKAEDHD